MKDIVTPVPQEEVRNVIKKCLENAALVNYTKVSEMTKIEGNIELVKFCFLADHTATQYDCCLLYTSPSPRD